MKAIFSATILRGKCEIRALFYRRFLFLSHMIIWHMRIACWIPKATNAHTGCVIQGCIQRFQDRTCKNKFAYLGC